MARTPRRLTSPQRDKIYQLCRSGRTSAVTATLCAEGDEEMRGFKVSPSHVRAIYMRERERRGELYRPQTTGLPNPKAIQNLVGRMIETAEREVERCERDQALGKLKPDHFAKLATALGRLDKLSSQVPAEPDPTKKAKEDAAKAVPAASSFTQRLMNGEAEPSDEPLSEDGPATPPVADVIVASNGSVPGPKPGAKAQAVPSDLDSNRDVERSGDVGLVPPAHALVGGSGVRSGGGDGSSIRDSA